MNIRHGVARLTLAAIVVGLSAMLAPMAVQQASALGCVTSKNGECLFSAPKFPQAAVKPPTSRGSPTGVSTPTATRVGPGWAVEGCEESLVVSESANCSNSVPSADSFPTVTVDGLQIPAIVLEQKYLAEGGRLAATPASGPRIQAAVAEAILRVLLERQAAVDGITATYSEATSVAQQQLNVYLNTPGLQGVVAIPANKTPQQYFMSPDTIHGYAIAISISREQRRIQDAWGLPANGALESWFTQELPRHAVLINGSPGAFSLTAALSAFLER